MNTKLHLVAGFLGSGKTTAIVNACKRLVSQGKRVGVITNDQGKYLVDTAFFKLEEIPTVEVGGGCFCCNYTDLEKQITDLIEKVQPDEIFAESVGSCADIVATVVKPLFLLSGSPLQPSSFSVFVDCRLLRAWLNDIPLPFSDDVVYIFEKQIEESSLVILNKMDILPEEQFKELLAQARQKWPRKIILPQVSLMPDGVDGWLELIESGSIPVPKQSLDMNYRQYGEGEQKLAWLDAEIEIESASGNLKEFVSNFMQMVRTRIEERRAAIGHIKFILQDSDGSDVKISFPTFEQQGWQQVIPDFSGTWLRVLMNARVEIPVDELKVVTNQVFADLNQLNGIAFTVIRFDAFHPAEPNPEFRI